MSNVLAIVIEPGYDRVIELGHELELLHYPDGQWRFKHRCDRGKRGVIICAPKLSPEHRIRDNGITVTVSPSILCSDCGVHGWARANVWVNG